MAWKLTRWRRTALVAVCGVVLGCSGTASNGDSAKTASEAVMDPVTGNPFANVEVYYPPYTNSDQARRRLEKEDPAQARLIAKIADTPQARWLGEWSGEIETVAGNYVKAANNKGKVALVVAYNIPNRDCGQYSSGGAADAAAYLAWIDALAKGIGPSRRAIVVLEPDALGHLEKCVSKEDQGPGWRSSRKPSGFWNHSREPRCTSTLVTRAGSPQKPWRSV